MFAIRKFFVYLQKILATLIITIKNLLAYDEV